MKLTRLFVKLLCYNLIVNPILFSREAAMRFCRRLLAPSTLNNTNWGVCTSLHHQHTPNFRTLIPQNKLLSSCSSLHPCLIQEANYVRSGCSHVTSTSLSLVVGGYITSNSNKVLMNEGALTTNLFWNFKTAAHLRSAFFLFSKPSNLSWVQKEEIYARGLTLETYICFDSWLKIHLTLSSKLHLQPGANHRKC